MVLITTSVIRSSTGSKFATKQGSVTDRGFGMNGVGVIEDKKTESVTGYQSRKRQKVEVRKRKENELSGARDAKKGKGGPRKKITTATCEKSRGRVQHTSGCVRRIKSSNNQPQRDSKRKRYRRIHVLRLKS